MKNVAHNSCFYRKALRVHFDVKFLENDRMAFADLKFAMIFLFQIVVGVWGNFSLLYHSVTLAFSGCKPRSTDLILRHLTVANSLVLLSRGIPRTMAAFGLRHFLNYFGCKLVLYIHRVARGVTIGTICLLSVFQAITISPRKSRWAELKAKALKYIGSFNTLCWVLHMLVNFIFPVFATGRWSNKTITMMFCPSPLHDKVSDSTYTALIAFHDVLCLGLMSWASGSMVFILNRHRQRVQHIHRTKASPRSSPETRGIHTVLVLVSAFVSFYTLSFVFYVYLALCDNPNWWVVTTSILITTGFPTVTPFVLMSRNPTVYRLCSFCCGRKTEFPDLIRKI
uniref:Vomeronasal type-1 receptor n=3 Tax=Panthera TaxID=9688 RepID=A0A8C8YC57_PANLE